MTILKILYNWTSFLFWLWLFKDRDGILECFRSLNFDRSMTDINQMWLLQSTGLQIIQLNSGL